MAMDTVLQQGFFTGTGNAQVIPLRSVVNWMSVVNYTQIAAAENVGVNYKWFAGMPVGGGLVQTQQGVWTALANPNGFTAIDTSAQFLFAPTTITNVSNDAIPVVTADGHGLITGDIVRLSNIVGGRELGGYDIRVTRVDANNFQLSWLPQVAAAASPGSSAAVRKLSNELYFVPKDRVITSVSQAVNAVVVFAAPHNFTVGQSVRFKVPTISNSSSYGMTQLDGVQASVIAVNTANNSITINVDTSGFSAFVFPTTAATNMQLAQCTPVGENTAVALQYSVDILGDATLNNAIIGMSLGGGAGHPAGAEGDLMYWIAGTSFSIN
jgi:hypothetical protein